MKRKSYKPRASRLNGKFHQGMHLEGGGTVMATISYRGLTPIQSFRLTSAIKTMNNTLMARMNMSTIQKCRHCKNEEILPHDRYCSNCGKFIDFIGR